ncbi:protein-disulfide reductase DsbD N-terminal domain-containing protein [Parapedobacter tibetensis]|uniref:protein-disulfide reductase DsbD N-terminal domain-containing protein n=1 Tax=Parapedobacter tibetensis TaxID=2972951 RepID=UPI00214DA1EC|nr:protein-disulfide reductase DsbD N-terminal domain-containing protein [Parapedobacter tibetensis]
MKRIILSSILLWICSLSYGQLLEPVKWSYAAKKVGKNEAVLFIKADIDAGWHLYSQHIADGGPVKTTFSFEPSKQYELVDKTAEPKPIKKHEEVFGMEVAYFEKQVVFQQKIKLKAGQTVVKGTVEYMVCDDQQCLPPDEKTFAITVK